MQISLTQGRAALARAGADKVWRFHSVRGCVRRQACAAHDHALADLHVGELHVRSELLVLADHHPRQVVARLPKVVVRGQDKRVREAAVVLVLCELPQEAEGGALLRCDLRRLRGWVGEEPRGPA